MPIGERIRALREAKNLSQGDLESRSGLLRIYISRVENEHIVPGVETLEKLAHGLGVPLYRLFYEARNLPEVPSPLKRKTADDPDWGKTRQGVRDWERFRHLLARMKESDRRLLLALAQKMAAHSVRLSTEKRGSMTNYVYWVVDCKTPGCESPILLYFLGPDRPSATHVLRAPDTIDVKCMSCRQTHPYRRDEIHTKIGSLPPADFVPHPLIG